MTANALVECYAGATYPERPRAFEVGGQRHEVAAVERQWRTPEGVAFRVRTGTGQAFTLFYHSADDSWSVIPE